MQLTTNIVTLNDTRAHGAGDASKCFYCSGLFGKEHESSCVCLSRPVKIELRLELIVDVVRSWDKDQIEFRYNESSYCMDNIIEDIQRHIAKEDNSESHCLCSRAEVKFIGEATLEEASAVGLTDDIRD